MFSWLSQLLAPSARPKATASSATPADIPKVNAVFPQVAIPLRGITRSGSGRAISAWLHDQGMWLVHLDSQGLRLIRFDLCGQLQDEWTLSDPGPVVGARIALPQLAPCAPCSAESGLWKLEEGSGKSWLLESRLEGQQVLWSRSAAEAPSGEPILQACTTSAIETVSLPKIPVPLRQVRQGERAILLDNSGRVGAVFYGQHGLAFDTAYLYLAHFQALPGLLQELTAARLYPLAYTGVRGRESLDHESLQLRWANMYSFLNRAGVRLYQIEGASPLHIKYRRTDRTRYDNYSGEEKFCEEGLWVQLERPLISKLTQALKAPCTFEEEFGNDFPGQRVSGVSHSLSIVRRGDALEIDHSTYADATQ